MSSRDGWILEKEIYLREVFDTVPGMPELTSKPVKTMWLSDIDPGHTERVFIRTTGFGRFSYNLNTGKLDTLKTDDGMVYGDPIFSYFAPTDGEFQ
nr:unnamed protein product [Digitaria exilis]